MLPRISSNDPTELKLRLPPAHCLCQWNRRESRAEEDLVLALGI